MEGEQGGGAAASGASPEVAALSDSFSQLWSDVMGMLVSCCLFMLWSFSRVVGGVVGGSLEEGLEVGLGGRWG